MSGVRQIAREFLDDPEHVNVGEKPAPPPSIHQSIYPVTPDNKGPMLLEILKREHIERAIVFTRTRSRADRVTRMLTRSGIKAVAIHGDRSQSQRNAAMGGFRARTFHVLVATDLAARGLDIPDVSHVINFDLPDEAEGYIHRIGRTARMGKPGEAMSLVTPEERVTLRRLEGLLGQGARSRIGRGLRRARNRAGQGVHGVSLVAALLAQSPARFLGISPALNGGVSRFGPANSRPGPPRLIRQTCGTFIPFWTAGRAPTALSHREICAPSPTISGFAALRSPNPTAIHG